MSNAPATIDPAVLDRARRKAYLRLLPILFACYVIAYIDRVNVSLAALTMAKDLPAFNNDVIGTGAGIFFIGYFLLEIPGTILVEKWSARKWICRIMVTWGICAAMTAWVKTPHQFYFVRFLLGLAEAGFFPGAIVFMTHWFPARDRTRALSWFMIGSPIAAIISPKVSNLLLEHNRLGMAGWQWMYIFWGIPAIILGILVLLLIPDKPRQASWLTEEEKQSLENALLAERAARSDGQSHLKLGQALRHPRVLLLALAYFCIQTGNYGVDTFMPSILKKWYSLNLSQTTWLVTVPPIGALIAILIAGWNSDRTGERRLHAAIPGLLGGVALGIAPLTQGHIVLTMICFIVAAAGLRAYLAPFWALPSLFLTEVAAAGSIGLINSIGNLGGFLGPKVLGHVETTTGSFSLGIYFLSGAMILYSMIVFMLGIGAQEKTGVAVP